MEREHQLVDYFQHWDADLWPVDGRAGRRLLMPTDGSAKAPGCRSRAERARECRAMRDEDIARRFAENLAHQLAESFATEEEIAARAELHPRELSRLLEGKQVPMLDTVV